MNGWSNTKTGGLVYTCTNHGSVQTTEYDERDRHDTIKAPNCCPSPKPPVPEDMLATFRAAHQKYIQQK